MPRRLTANLRRSLAPPGNEVRAALPRLPARAPRRQAFAAGWLDVKSSASRGPAWRLADAKLGDTRWRNWFANGLREKARSNAGRSGPGDERAGTGCSSRVHGLAPGSLDAHNFID